MRSNRKCKRQNSKKNSISSVNSSTHSNYEPTKSDLNVKTKESFKKIDQTMSTLSEIETNVFYKENKLDKRFKRSVKFDAISSTENSDVS